MVSSPSLLNDKTRWLFAQYSAGILFRNSAPERSKFSLLDGLPYVDVKQEKEKIANTVFSQMELSSLYVWVQPEFSITRIAFFLVVHFFIYIFFLSFQKCAKANDLTDPPPLINRNLRYVDF